MYGTVARLQVMIACHEATRTVRRKGSPLLEQNKNEQVLSFLLVSRHREDQASFYGPIIQTEIDLRIIHELLNLFSC